MGDELVIFIKEEFCCQVIAIRPRKLILLICLFSAIYIYNTTGHLHTYRFCDNVWTFILQDALFKSEECQETVNRVKIVACDSKLLTQ
ncbi:hypothetical protein RDI58_028405 [Solanum bulbocastanum]|uniref:Transcription initiation factor IIA gamma subunit C-terminal domain-containing protein n=1 Tax=Solanum bulbocastanum TaxID=147425 RepID=A0AAN8SST8_SOLBU